MTMRKRINFEELQKLQDGDVLQSGATVKVDGYMERSQECVRHSVCPDCGAIRYYAGDIITDCECDLFD